MGSSGATAGRDVRTKRVSTGAVAGGATVELTVTWTEAFPNADYTVSAAVSEPTAGTSTLTVRRLVSQTASQVVVRVENADTLNPRTGTLHLIAVAD